MDRKILFWLVPLLAGAALTVWLINPGLAIVPNVVGKLSSIAVPEITNSGFVPYLTFAEGGTIDVVTSQAPKPGELRRKGSTVALVVFKGVEPARVMTNQTIPMPEAKVNEQSTQTTATDNISPQMEHTSESHTSMSEHSGLVIPADFIIPVQITFTTEVTSSKTVVSLVQF